jgi:uncharacterized cupredoxin-like copper-binding protein
VAVKWSKSIKGCAVVVATVLSVAACAGSTPPPSALSANLSEFKVGMTSAKAAAGTVTFTIKNTGAVMHEFVVIKSDLATDKLPATAEGKVDEASTELSGIDEVEDIAPGATATLKVDLAVGRYVLICNIPGHYTGGMRTALEVAAAS